MSCKNHYICSPSWIVLVIFIQAIFDLVIGLLEPVQYTDTHTMHGRSRRPAELKEKKHEQWSWLSYCLANTLLLWHLGLSAHSFTPGTNTTARRKHLSISYRLQRSQLQTAAMHYSLGDSVSCSSITGRLDFTTIVLQFWFKTHLNALIIFAICMWLW